MLIFTANTFWGIGMNGEGCGCIPSASLHHAPPTYPANRICEKSFRPITAELAIERRGLNGARLNGAVLINSMEGAERGLQFTVTDLGRQRSSKDAATQMPSEAGGDQHSRSRLVMRAWTTIVTKHAQSLSTMSRPSVNHNIAIPPHWQPPASTAPQLVDSQPALPRGRKRLD